MQRWCKNHIFIQTFNGINYVAVADNSTADESRLFMDEIRVMKRVSDSTNPHVLQMIGCVTNTLPPMILLEFVQHGNLKDHLRTLKEVTIVRRICGVARNLAHSMLATACVESSRILWD